MRDDVFGCSLELCSRNKTIPVVIEIYRVYRSYIKTQVPTRLLASPKHTITNNNIHMKDLSLTEVPTHLAKHFDVIFSTMAAIIS